MPHTSGTHRAPLLVSCLLQQARERGHMHVTDLVIHAHKFHNEAILLIHFSPRYKKQVRAQHQPARYAQWSAVGLP